MLPVIGTADAKPTVQVRELVQHYFTEIDAQLAKLHQLLTTGVAEINRQIQDAALPPVAA